MKNLDQANKLIRECLENQNTYLDIGNCGITNLGDLPELFECTQLKTLILSNKWYDRTKRKEVSSQNLGRQNNIIYLTQNIKRLKNLQCIIAGGYYNWEESSFNGEWQIRDIGFLKELNALNSLNLSLNKISDISFLKELTALNSLDLSSNEISDISYLKDLTALNSLYLFGNKISDISFLKELTAINSLDLDFNNISDISYLKELTALNSLDLSFNDIPDISYLKDLTALNSLDLSGNNISDINYLKDLTALNSLDLGGNKISNISFLKELTALNTLDLSSNEISDISNLKELTALNSLKLSFNNISDYSFLKELTALNSLDLGGNKISDISFLKKLTALNSLDLSSNNISDISFLKELTGLNSLDLSGNNISDINYLKDLTGLISLDLRGNNISDINYLKDLTGLNSLNLSHNNISDISFLKDLTGLNPLELSRNNISYVPEFIFDLNNNERVLRLIQIENPISNPPIETIKQGKEAALNWFKAIREKFNEVKVILIGEPEAGKTSLLKRLKFDDFYNKEPQTDGINIVDIDFKDIKTFESQESLHGIKGRFWDFGGQEVLSATHRIFLSSRAVYILFLQARDDKANEKQVRDWIKQIKANGGNSPIIVVANKIDVNPSFDFENRFSIEQDFEQVKDFIKISCSTRENIDQLKDKLAEIIPQSGFLKSEIDIRIINLKELIKAKTAQKDYLSEQEFIELCDEDEVKLQDKTLRKEAIDFLDKIGIASYFDKIKTMDYYVLDPNWVTTALYRIITSEKIARLGGEVDIKDLEYILNEEPDKIGKNYNNPFTDKEFEYNLKQDRSFIAEILLRYKLAFKLNEEKYIIPGLLHANPEASLFKEFQNSKTLDFVFAYESLPKNIISELLVLFHRFENLINYWRTGGVIEKSNAKALITASNDKISISVESNDAVEGRDLMIHCRAVLDLVNKDLPTPPTKFIPLPGLKGEMVRYEVLVNRMKKGKKTYTYHEDLNDEKEYDIGDLLDGISSEDDIKRMLRNIQEDTNKLSRIEANTEKILDSLERQFDELLELDKNSNLSKSRIISAVQKISDAQRDNVFQDLIKVLSIGFELHQSELTAELKQLYDDLKRTDGNLDMKIKASVPLLNLLGLDIGVERNFDIKTWSKKMYKKYELDLFRLFGHL